MARYILLRIAQAIPTLAFLVILTFVVVRITPGDPAYAIAGDNASADYIAHVRVAYGLDKPVLEQLWLYVSHLIVGDLGTSYTYHSPVLGVVMGRLGASLLLVACGLVLGIVGGTYLGAYASRIKGTLREAILNFASLTLYSVPIFWLGLLLIYVFAIKANLVPAGGIHSLPPPTGFAATLDLLDHLALPTLTLALYTFPVYYRLTRSRMSAVMNDEYIRTARAIGFAERRVFFRHGLRNAILPSLTMAGLTIGQSIGGALLTEAVFAWPGVGTLMQEAIGQRDLPLIMGVFIVVAISVLVATIVTDVLYVVADPRVRLS
ncbi:MAG TPA: ABC transporter permease [Lacisediminihabitans sp.]|uniref:ABC transporter permease n=1 Tax=Lacisediminihabitans sp. TaxID=2787631 RepID=UPI002EDB3B5D